MSAELAVWTERVLAARDAAEAAAMDAVRQCGEAVRRAAECGRLLTQLREHLRGSQGWEAWLRDVWGGGADRRTTAYRWMRLGEAPEELLTNATSLRQAYIAVGLLPAAEPTPLPPGAEKPAWNYLVHLSRAERALQKQRQELARLSSQERSVLKERLRPLVEVYNAL